MTESPSTDENKINSKAKKAPVFSASWLEGILKYCILIILGGALGHITAEHKLSAELDELYEYIREVEQQKNSQIAVYDAARAIENIQAGDDIDVMTEELEKTVAQLKSNGTVILDGSLVYSAPDDVYITPSTDEKQ